MQYNFRHEHKFIIDTRDYAILRSRFMKILRPDPFADSSNNYHVRSLYFDDPGNSSLLEKTDGEERRKKYRIRIYNRCDATIKFEIKNKVNEYVHKHSAFLSREECRKILNHDFSFLAGRGQSALSELFTHMRIRRLRPVVLVDYVREAYVHPVENVRITFDKDLTACLNLHDFFAEQFPQIRVIRRPALILEVKYQRFLPAFIGGLFRDIHRTREAVSKFARCMEKIR